MLPNERQLVLRLKGPLAERGHVPFRVLTDKLVAMQQMMFAIGTSVRGGGRRGPLRADVAESCELFFVAAQPGSLQIVSEIAPPQPSVMPEYFDLGAQSLALFGSTIRAAQEEDIGELERVYPDPALRTRVLRRMVELLPEDEADYEVELEHRTFRTTLPPQLRDPLRRMTRQPLSLPDEEIRRVTGTLYKIEIQTGSPELGVRVRNRQIPCHFSSQDEEFYRDLVPGSLVEVEGRAILSDLGEISQIAEVTDAVSTQLVPLHWQRVTYGDRTLWLREPIQIPVEFHDGLWVHEFEPLGIVAFAETRKESVEALRMEFFLLWDEYAQEDDSRLTGDAAALKRKVLAIVEREERL